MISIDTKSAPPKYQQLAERVRARIECGDLGPGDQLPTLLEMHDTHGLSRPTVEKAYSILQQQ